jgi:hypothetical protein
MSQFFNSLKADLLDRRLLPFLALVAVAFLAAVGYAVLGGGGSSTTTPTASSPSPQPSTKTGSIAVTPATTGAQQPVAETTHGASAQHGGSSRNPFTPLPGAKTSTSGGASPSTGGSSSSRKSSGSNSSAQGSGGTTPAPAPTPKPTTPSKPPVYTHFHVNVQFGVVPAPVAATPPQPAQLKTYNDINLDKPFPGKANPQLVYLGVVLKTGKEAAFALTGAAILHGSATCKPSPTQCQAIVLQIGQTETLEVVEGDGSTVTYELKLLTIARSVSASASTARVHDALRAESKVARELRRRAPALSELRYSAQRGGLVFVARKSFVARAHAADRR